MREQNAPEYALIRAAVAGEKWAIEKVVAYYQGEIDKEATVRKRQPDGSWKEEIDEDLRQQITMKLIEAIPQFPLAELERAARKREKEQ